MLEAFWQSFNAFVILRIWSKFRAILDSADNFVASFGLDPNKLAQIGHFLAGYALTFTAYVVGWVFGGWWAGLIVGGIISGPWVLWKEAYRDTKAPENAPFWPGTPIGSGLSQKQTFIGSGLFDATMYWAGVMVATGVAAAIGMAFPK